MNQSKIEKIKNQKNDLYHKLKSTFNQDNSFKSEEVNLKDKINHFKTEWLRTAYNNYTICNETASYEALKRIIVDISDDLTKKINNIVKSSSTKIQNIKKENSKLLNHFNIHINDSPNYNFKNIESITAITILFLITILSGCGESEVFKQKTLETPNNINVILGLDLSDRFLQDENERFLPVEYDFSVISSAYTAWESVINDQYNKGIDVSRINGTFSVLPIPMPHDRRRSISAFGFEYDLSQLPIIERWKYLPHFRDSVMNRTKLIYNSALQIMPDGADIWQFFLNLDLYLKQPTDSNTIWLNKVIILTDGYPYISSHLKQHRMNIANRRDYLEEKDMQLLRNSPDWIDVFEKRDMGFLSVGKKYQNVEVLIIGFNEPESFRGSAKEMLIVHQFWSDWLEDMGITKKEFLPLNSPVTEQKINRFINSK